MRRNIFLFVLLSSLHLSRSFPTDQDLDVTTLNAIIDTTHEEQNDCLDNCDEVFNSLSTESTVEASTEACNSDTQFYCEANQKCIPRARVCDGVHDCPDGADEEAYVTCRVRKCDHDNGEFTCRNGHCILMLWRCDLEDDCGDGSDEPVEFCQNRKCRLGYRMCRNNYRCIPKWYFCDGKDDCGDGGSDELHCESLKDQEDPVVRWNGPN